MLVSILRYIFYILIILECQSAFAENCSANQHWVKAHYRRPYYKANGTFVKGTDVSAHCKNNRPSYIFWRERIRNGLPPDWPHKTEELGNWTPEETERLVEALEEVPSSLWSEKNKGIYRLKKSKEFPNPATSSDGLIVLYDTAFSKDSRERPLTRILVHELAHQMYLDLPTDERESYHMVTNWLIGKSKKTGRNIYFSRKDGYVQDDGRLSPEEDFANNIEYFIFKPTELRSKTPHAYRWINEHSGDKFKSSKRRSNENQ